jgi:hypothetical protein
MSGGDSVLDNVAIQAVRALVVDQGDWGCVVSIIVNLCGLLNVNGFVSATRKVAKSALRAQRHPHDISKSFCLPLQKKRGNVQKECASRGLTLVHNFS